MAEGARTFVAIYRDDPAKTREVWTIGQASDRFKSEAKSLGWQVHDRWQPATKDDADAAKAGGG